MTLYPKLEDHDLVKNYPHVRGVAEDVFFFTHDHKENGGEDDFASKYNQYEVSNLNISNYVCSYSSQIYRLI